MDQRDDSERKLHAEDHLAEKQKMIGAGVTGKVNGQGRGDDGQAARDQPAQPRPHTEIKKALHHDLAGESAGERG